MRREEIFGKPNNHSDIVFRTVTDLNASAMSQVAASWRRSALTHGLDPSRYRNQTLVGNSQLAIEKSRNEKLLWIARPIIDSMFNAVGQSGCCVALTNKHGLVLESRCHSGDTRDFEDARLIPGADWNEASEGTNGIGTCIVEQRPITIYKNQHFYSKNIDMSCIDAPVRDHRGNLVAALDISTCRTDHNEMLVSMLSSIVIDAARKIESSYFHHSYNNARIVQANDDLLGAPALLAIDGDDLVIGATRAARKIFGLTDEMLANPLPASDLFGGEKYDGELQSAEKSAMRRALARSKGNVKEAAKTLGIGRATFYRRMKKLGLH